MGGQDNVQEDLLVEDHEEEVPLEGLELDLLTFLDLDCWAQLLADWHQA